MNEYNDYDNIINDLKNNIKDNIEIDNEKEKVNENDLKEFAKIINYPYDLLANNIDSEFSLSDNEKIINEQLTYLVLIYYLPYINLGKFSLIALILFNISLLSIKTIKVIEKKRKKSEPEPEPKPEPETKSEPELEPKSEPEPKKKFKIKPRDKQLKIEPD